VFVRFCLFRRLPLRTRMIAGGWSAWRLLLRHIAASDQVKASRVGFMTGICGAPHGADGTARSGASRLARLSPAHFDRRGRVNRRGSMYPGKEARMRIVWYRPRPVYGLLISVADVDVRVCVITASLVRPRAFAHPLAPF